LGKTVAAFFFFETHILNFVIILFLIGKKEYSVDTMGGGHGRNQFMHKPAPLIVLQVCVLFAAGIAQELCLSTAAKTYASGEQVWVNLAVLNAGAVPGAYKVRVTYDTNKLRYSNILPAKSPFFITPAASIKNGMVTIAGFQGIADTGSGNASLVTLVFTPKSGPAAVDTGSFLFNSSEVFNAKAREMDLKTTKQAASVLLPSPDRGQRQRIFLTKKYIRFSLVMEGIASVRLFDLNGRVRATPLPPTFCKAGHHAIPLGNALPSGVYLAAVRGAGLSAAEKLEVVR
jgi:hypothetical protein